MQFLVETLEGRTQCLSFAVDSVSEGHLRQAICDATGIPAHLQTLSLASKPIPAHATFSKQLHQQTLVGEVVVIDEWAIIRVSLRLEGGKGGFGSLLRTASARVGQKKTSNYSACRDLNGRRLRHVEAEQKIAELASGPPAKADSKSAVVKQFRAIKTGERAPRKPCKFGDACKYKWKCRGTHPVDAVNAARRKGEKNLGAGFGSVESIAREDVLTGVEHGLAIAAKRKATAKSAANNAAIAANAANGNGNTTSTNHSTANGNGSSSSKSGQKRKRSDSEESIEENEDDLMMLKEKIKGPRARQQKQQEQQQQQQQEAADQEEQDQNQAPPAADDGDDDDFIPVAFVPKRQRLDTPAAVSVNKLKKKKVQASAATPTATTTPTPTTATTTPTATPTPTPATVPTPIATNISTPAASTNIAVTTPLVEVKSVDLLSYGSAHALEALGMEGLKQQLTLRGLKCGGALKERAERLFLLQSTAIGQIPKKHLAAKSK
jgi:hypothetical protein